MFTIRTIRKIAATTLILSLIYLITFAPYIDVGCYDCVSNPITELVETINKAKTGVDYTTGTLCMSTRESFSTLTLQNRLDSSLELGFLCTLDTCDGYMAVTTERIEAQSRLEFSINVRCNNKVCDLDIIDADKYPKILAEEALKELVYNIIIVVFVISLVVLIITTLKIRKPSFNPLNFH
jgi:hypothetical protein